MTENKPKTWRRARSLRAIQARLEKDIRVNCPNGCDVTINVGLARALVSVVKQAYHTEISHEQPIER